MSYAKTVIIPKNKREGLANAVQLAINELVDTDKRESALLRLVDLWNDITSESNPYELRRYGRCQTTFTFNSQNKASLFCYWLDKNKKDIDSGRPTYINSRQVGNIDWCVEYSYDSNSNIAPGVAIGISLS
jgi:hypothetical protein